MNKRGQDKDNLSPDGSALEAAGAISDQVQEESNPNRRGLEKSQDKSSRSNKDKRLKILTR
jgi:hypothetical protein